MVNLWALQSYPSGVLTKKLVQDPKKGIGYKIINPKISHYIAHKSDPIKKISDIATLLNELRPLKNVALVMGKPTDACLNTEGPIRRLRKNFMENKTNILILDVDHSHLKPLDYISMMPDWINNVSCICHKTARYGLNEKYAFRLFYLCDRNISLSEQKKLAKKLQTDEKIYTPERLIYTADPIGNAVLKYKNRVLLIEKEKDFLSIKEPLKNDFASLLKIITNKIKFLTEGERNDGFYKECVGEYILACRKHKVDPWLYADEIQDAGMLTGLGVEEVSATFKSALKNTDTTDSGAHRQLFYIAMQKWVSERGQYIRSDNNEFFIKLGHQLIDIDSMRFEYLCVDVHEDKFSCIPGNPTDLGAVRRALKRDVSKLPTSPVYRRIAPYKDGIVINLDQDGKCIYINPLGYKVFEKALADVFFVDVDLSGNLPTPEEHDETVMDIVSALFDHLTHHQKVLMCCYLIGSLNPLIKYPVLCANGVRGSGKSTLCSTIKYWVDPDTGDLANQLNGAPDDPRDLQTIALNKHVTVLDNLSYLSNQMSDILSCIATGNNAQARKLYSDSDIANKRLRRPIMMTSINTITRQSDLADRSISIVLSKAARYMDEVSIQELVDWTRPKLLHALCKSYAIYLRTIDTFPIQHVHRMGGWVSVALGASRAPEFGVTEREIYSALKKDRRDTAAEVLDQSTLVDVLLKFLDARHNKWVGSPGELKLKLDLTLGSARPPADWPKAPTSLAHQLNMLKPDLEKIYQIKIEKIRKSRERVYSITKGF